MPHTHFSKVTLRRFATLRKPIQKGHMDLSRLSLSLPLSVCSLDILLRKHLRIYRVLVQDSGSALTVSRLQTSRPNVVNVTPLHEWAGDGLGAIQLCGETDPRCKTVSLIRPRHRGGYLMRISGRGFKKASHTSPHKMRLSVFLLFFFRVNSHVLSVTGKCF